MVDRHAFQAQLTGGRTAVIHNGVTKHVGGSGSGGSELNGHMTVTVAVEREM